MFDTRLSDLVSKREAECIIVLFTQTLGEKNGFLDSDSREKTGRTVVRPFSRQLNSAIHFTVTGQSFVAIRKPSY